MTSFEVLSAADAVIRTFDNRRAAVAWANDQRDTFPGLRVEAVERIEHRRRVWSDRMSLRVVA